MDKKFKVTIELNTKQPMSIFDIQRIFRNFCFKDENISDYKIKTEPNKK